LFEKETLRVKAYEHIKNKIIYFDLKPGDKILEDQISGRLGISRTPVREALLMLENEGLVKCDDRLGFIIRKLSSKDVDEYFSIRKTLELFGVPLIIERISSEEIELLQKNIDEAEYYVERGDFRSIVKYESKFHEILYKSIKSEIFFETISTLIDKFQWLRAIALKTSGGFQESLSDHKKILKAVTNRDTKELKKLIQSHIRHAKKSALKQGFFF
jgi:DNA-binding GntR family transcriptional regulator